MDIVSIHTQQLLSEVRIECHGIVTVLSVWGARRCPGWPAACGVTPPFMYADGMALQKRTVHVISVHVQCHDCISLFRSSNGLKILYYRHNDIVSCVDSKRMYIVLCSTGIGNAVWYYRYR